MGDDQSGFYNKVVFNNTTNNENEATDEKKKKKTDGKKSMSSEEGGAQQLLSKKERQKLKRKAKKEAAKERKRLKKAQEEEEEGVDNNDDGMKGDSKTSAVANIDDESTLQKQQQQQQQQQQQEEVEQLQTTWSISAPGITLHSTLCTGLHSLNYTYPTPIQSATLPAAILGRRDIVGAAPTGSGKTLSFGLPILQYLLDNDDNDNGDDASSREQQQHPKQKKKLPLQALILTPTRELAMQVTEELRRVSCNNIPIGTIVGGFAEVKQKRILDKTRPPILVATPGRLWELVSFFV